jgi:site-specific DNA-cytosine methylase
LSAPPSLGPVVGSVCTGYGGLDLGVLAALGGGRIAWCADPDPHITQILSARMPSVPNLGDLRAIDWTAVEPVEVLTAGFPCQDISAAGRRAGIDKGQRSGLWTDIVAGVRTTTRDPGVAEHQVPQIVADRLDFPARIVEHQPRIQLTWTGHHCPVAGSTTCPSINPRCTREIS